MAPDKGFSRVCYVILESLPREFQGRQPGQALQPYSVLPHGSRHPVRHVSFNSHSLITANVPYEKVVRNSDMDNFACHRRSVRAWAHPEKWYTQTGKSSVLSPSDASS